MNINSILSNFAQQELVLARTSIERNRIDSSLTQLEKVISSKLNVKQFIRFGSYTRNTILPRKYYSKSDIDLMVVFNTANGVMTSGTYRNYILDVLSYAYPNSISKKDFPVIKLQLNHIMFDVVPAYSEDSFWGGRNYYIPDSGNGWRLTVPNDINDELANKNQSYGGNIIRQVIRLCKHWNASAGYPLESYLMEKEIVNLMFWGNENTYERFIKTLSSIAGHQNGVQQALDYIYQYQGGLFSSPDYQKQLHWLKKLLPGLNRNY